MAREDQCSRGKLLFLPRGRWAGPALSLCRQRDPGLNLSSEPLGVAAKTDKPEGSTAKGPQNQGRPGATKEGSRGWEPATSGLILAVTQGPKRIT